MMALKHAFDAKSIIINLNLSNGRIIFKNYKWKISTSSKFLFLRINKPIKKYFKYRCLK